MSISNEIRHQQEMLSLHKKMNIKYIKLKTKKPEYQGGKKSIPNHKLPNRPTLVSDNAEHSATLDLEKNKVN